MKRRWREESAIRYYGLQNQGATCYLNSVLHVLFMTKDFREAVPWSADEGIDSELARLFYELGAHSPDTRDFTSKMGITSGSVQGDAAEFFGKLLSSVKSEAASRIFEGKLALKSVCGGCQKETSTDEPFWHLPLEMEGREYEDFSVVAGLEKYFSKSCVDGLDQIYCEECHAKADATIRFEVEHHPEVMTLMLKRFQFDSYWRKFVKNSRKVVVPYKLTIKDQKYELYAFVEHVGELTRGHYTATIKSSDDENWYHFNDTRVRVLSYQPFQVDRDYRSWDAYLLFYRKEKDIQSGVTSEEETSVATRPNGDSVEAAESKEAAAAAAAGVESVTRNKDGSVTDDGGREKPELTKDHADRKEKEETGEPPASADGDRSGTVGELRAQSPTDVKVESVNRDAAAGQNKETTKLLTKYDLTISSGSPQEPNTTRNSHAETQLGVKEKETQIQNGCYKAERVQATDGHSDQTDERSGQNSLCGERAETDQHQTGDENHLESTRHNEEKKEEKEDVQRGDDEKHLESTRYNKEKKMEEDVQRGDDENGLHKPNKEVRKRPIEDALTRSYSRHNQDKKEEEEEEEKEDVQRGDEEPETRGGCGGHSSQSADVQDNQLSEGAQRIRRQEGLTEKTRDEDARGGRPESTSENRQQAHLRLRLSGNRQPIRTKGREEEEVKRAPQETGDVDGLSEKLKNMMLRDPASSGTQQHSDRSDSPANTKRPTSGAHSGQCGDAEYGAPSQPAMGMTQQQHWVTQLAPGYYQSVAGIILQQPQTQTHQPAGGFDRQASDCWDQRCTMPTQSTYIQPVVQQSNQQNCPPNYYNAVAPVTTLFYPVPMQTIVPMQHPPIHSTVRTPHTPGNWMQPTGPPSHPPTHYETETIYYQLSRRNTDQSWN